MPRESMTRVLCSSIVLFLVCTALVAASAAAESEKESPGPVPGSFFQGVWIGEWAGFQDTSIRQEAAVEVGQEIRDGVFEVQYSWGEAKYLKKTVPAGKTSTKGMVREGAFHFSWKNKQGRLFEMTLRKLEENRVKARLERSGPSEGDRPYSETTLKRK